MINKKTPGSSAEVIQRRRELAMEICRQRTPILKAKIPMLNPVLAAAYATKQEKTLSRDLSALEEAGLVHSTPQGWLAITDTMYWRHRRQIEELLP
jgi:hypothetical protein